VIERYSPLLRLASSVIIKPFDCTKDDLNDFLFNDAKGHVSELLAVTYLLEDSDDTIAYFSVLNDCIKQKDLTPGRIRRLFKPIPYRHSSHPAVKIGRLAVNTKYQSLGIGSEIMDYIKGYFLDNNKTGCRFITVDADNDPKTLKFYEKNEFDYLTESDKNDPSRLMYFDLIRYAAYVNIS
jgi:GNAT superfamily N-acetyltransferase